MLRDIVVDPAQGEHRVVYHPTLQRYFRLGKREAGFLESLDGSRSMEQLREGGNHGFEPQQVDRMIDWFSGNLLLEGTVAPPEPEPLSWSRRAVEAIAHTDRWRVNLINPNAILDRHRKGIDRLFSRPAMLLYLLAFLLPVFTFIVAPGAAIEASRAGLAMPYHQWFLLYVMILVVNVGHELAHAVTCKHFGGKVERIGLMFLYLHPVAFCDVSASWRFRDTGHKIAVAAAGIFFQLVLAGIALTAWMISGVPVLAYFAMLNVALAIFNLFPLVKLDGYWMLVHLTNEPALRQRGLGAVDSLVRRLLGRGSAPRAPAGGGLLTFGLAHVVVLPAFWVLGIFGIYRVASKLSEVLALVLASVLAAALCYRALRSGQAYLNTLRVPA
jgi:putative peptide zinc metalloprotease protein